MYRVVVLGVAVRASDNGDNALIDYVKSDESTIIDILVKSTEDRRINSWESVDLYSMRSSFVEPPKAVESHSDAPVRRPVRTFVIAGTVFCLLLGLVLFLLFQQSVL